MNYKDRITNDEFMDDFIANCNYSYKKFGDYKQVYDTYDLSEDDVEKLLEYCIKMEYISG